MAKFVPKIFPLHDLLRVSTCCSSSVRFLRGNPPEVARNLQQRLLEIANKQKDPTLHFKVNIGLPQLKPSRREEYKNRIKILQELKANSQLQKENIALSDIRNEWLKTSGPFHVKRIAEHFNIFEDLFGEAYFIPRIPLNIKYYQDGYEIPVFTGNQIKPNEAKSAPSVLYEAPADSLWSILLTNPDGHFTDSSKEYLHWFIGNIPGNDISKGECIVDYLQPFPPRGIGSQRMVFILYKQEKLIDFTSLKKQSPCVTLSERTFSTLEFYRENQDVITPAGLAFFQSDWDTSLTDFFHHVLDMKEPIYEYDFPAPYRKPQRWFPKKEAFNLYLDKHRDPKQIAKELLLKRLKNVDPFKPPEKEPRFPNAFPEDNKLPSWIRVEIRKQRLKWGRYSDM